MEFIKETKVTSKLDKYEVNQLIIDHCASKGVEVDRFSGIDWNIKTNAEGKITKFAVNVSGQANKNFKG